MEIDAEVSEELVDYIGSVIQAMMEAGAPHAGSAQRETSMENTRANRAGLTRERVDEEVEEMRRSPDSIKFG